MMDKINSVLSGIFTLLFSVTLAQTPVNIILTGKVAVYGAGKSGGYIYYTEPGEKFSAEQRIKYDTSLRYIFESGKTRYKNKTSGTLVFAIDTSNSTIEEHSCIHKINIGAITSYARSKKLQKISISNDIMPEHYCEAGVYQEADDFEKKYFGIYKTKDKKEKLDLWLALNRVVYDYPMAQDLSTQKTGTWEITGNNQITLDLYFRLNPEFGTMLRAEEKISFTILETNKGTTITDPNGTQLIKIHPSYEYTDMSNNKYIITKDSVQYIPITKEQSSTGMYSGGDPANVKITPADYQQINEYMSELLKLPKLEQREKITVLIKKTEDGTTTTAIIRGAYQTRKLEMTLKNLINTRK